MQLLGIYRCETEHNYAIKFINGDEECFYEENRGRYCREDIFDIYPTLKDDIKGYTIQKVSERNSKFTIQTLRNFAVNKPKEYTEYKTLILISITELFLKECLIHCYFLGDFIGVKIKQDNFLMAMSVQMLLKIKRKFCKILSRQ